MADIPQATEGTRHMASKGEDNDGAIRARGWHGRAGTWTGQAHTAPLAAPGESTGGDSANAATHAATPPWRGIAEGD